MVFHGRPGGHKPEMPCEATREPTVSSFHTTELSLGLQPRRSATFRFDARVEFSMKKTMKKHVFLSETDGERLRKAGFYMVLLQKSLERP